MADTAPTFLMLLAFLTTLVADSTQQPVLDASEQESVYRVLELINGDVPWRVLFPDDLCVSAPHGVVCDYFFDENSTSSDKLDSAHITELNLGYVSDYNSNPSCAANAKLLSSVFSSLPRLRKLFVFNCFINGDQELQVSFPDVPPGCGTELEELVLIDNPSLSGSLDGIVRSFVNLRKLVVTGSRFYGGIPDEAGGLVRLEQMTLSGNRLNGVVPGSLTNVTSLKVIDLSRNAFQGPVPESIGQLRSLLKLDLSFNYFTGKIPDQIGELLELEFLDLSYNRLEGHGVPMFFSKMVRLKEVYLSGNELGGEIPDIWEKHGGLVGLGLSGLGLTGEIPESMAESLKSLSYLGLGNNSLEGKVPDGFLLGMENLKEINLENNNLSGAITLTAANVSTKRLKLAGNPGLCVDRSLTGRNTTSINSFRHGLRACDDSSSEMPVSAHLLHHHASSSASASSTTCGLLVGFIGLVLSFVYRIFI